MWNLVAFTASNRTYAESILDRLDPNNNLVSNILSREHCHPHGNRFVKDFRMVTGPLTPLDRILLIDNRVSSFGMNLTNGIPIFPFKGQESDKELKHILPVLDQLARPDVNIQSWIATKYKYEALFTKELEEVIKAVGL